MNKLRYILRSAKKHRTIVAVACCWQWFNSAGVAQRSELQFSKLVTRVRLPSPAPEVTVIYRNVQKITISCMKILIVGVIIFLLMVGGFLYLGYTNYQLPIQKDTQRQPVSQPIISPTSSPNTQSVEIELSNKEYKQGESITLIVTNNTGQNIYYFPETCASSLVHVFLVQDDKFIPIQDEPKICQLAPSVQILPADKSITNKIADKTLSKMTSGIYKIQFRYSFEMRDRFGLGESILVESDTFTIVR